jgi:hypothetical protein
VASSLGLTYTMGKPHGRHVHHNAEAYLDAYIQAAEIAGKKRATRTKTRLMSVLLQGLARLSGSLITTRSHPRSSLLQG